MVLAQKQTRRPMEQNRRSRNKPTQLQPCDFFSQRIKKHTLAKRQSLQQMVPGKQIDLHAKD
jgi:hypothetical protein